jgi:hypothetical protein
MDYVYTTQSKPMSLGMTMRNENGLHGTNGSIICGTFLYNWLLKGSSH